MPAVAIWTLKGGVGKTATAVNLAHVAAEEGTRVLLWDLDPQGAASFYLRVAPHLKGGAGRVVRKNAKLDRHACPTDFANLSLLPADFSYRHLDLELDAKKRPHRRFRTTLRALQRDVDLVLLDCPPSVSLVSEAVLYAVDALLVPVIPSTLSLRTLEQVRRFAAEMGRARLQVLPFLSMVDRRKRLHRDVSTELSGGAGGFLETTIPSASVVERMGLGRQPVTAEPRTTPAAEAFRRLWVEVAEKLEMRR